MAPLFQALTCWKQLLTHVAVGMGAASFWRGAWYMLDDQLFPEYPNLSAAASLAMGTTGMAASQGIVARAMAVQQPALKRVARFGALYTVAMSCVLVWRGTWVGWDCVYEHYHNEWAAAHKKKLEDDDDSQEERPTRTSTPTELLAKVAAAANAATTTSTSTSTTLLATSSSFLEHSPAHAAIKSTDPGHLTYSGLYSHVFAIVALGACGVFASVLAPPAAVSVIKDLAIQATRTTSKKGRTTTYFKNQQFNSAAKAEINNRSYEFLPFMAPYLSTSSSSSASSRIIPSTATRGSVTTTSTMMANKAQP